MSAHAHTTLSVEQFLTKNVFKEKRFADVGDMKQKMAEALKIKIDKFKKLF